MSIQEQINEIQSKLSDDVEFLTDKEKAIKIQKAKNEKFIASPDGQALTKEQIDEKREKIFIVLAKFIPKGDSKYTQFISTFIDKLE